MPESNDLPDAAHGYPLPTNEDTRLAALRKLEILDTDPEMEFDRITRLARVLFGTPIAAVSLVDEHRQWFKSISGLQAEETPRDQAFCAHTILDDQPLVVLDAESDARFARNPLVTGEPSIRFYAGVPLQTQSGEKIGSLCIIDNKVRENWSIIETNLLKDLGELVSNELKSREKHKEHEEISEELRVLRSQAPPDALLIDELTGLPDRRALETVIMRSRSTAEAADRFLGLVYIDVDKISAVNDTHGEAGGDKVLKVLAYRFKNAFRSNDTVLRIAGDQFFVVLQGLELTSGVDRPIRNLLRLAATPIPIEGANDIAITVSAGVAFYPHCGSTPMDLITAAKNAMLASKEAGGNVCTITIPGKEITHIS